MKDLHREEPKPSIEERVATALERIEQTLQRVDMAMMHQIGLGTLNVSPEADGGVTFSLDFHGAPPEPPEMRQAGTTKAHKGANVWEFVPPPPHTGVVIVCALDEEAPLGMRCYAEVKMVGGERRRYPMPIMEG